MIRRMVSPTHMEAPLEKRNVFIGEAFGPPDVRVVFAGAAEDTQEREDRVFLLIGPSCVREEKASLMATCIDAFCNFFYGVEKENAYRLHIANEKFDKTTPNKAIVTYVFNDSKMPFRPIVVDVKDDDASLLHKWLTENARLRIDVVCIVFNLLGRIETKHETAIKDMLSILPKRIRSSASVLLTNSDGNPPPVALLRRFDLQEAPVYKLNWTTLFTGRPDDSLKELLRANYWIMSDKSLKDMISRIHTLHPQTFNGLPHEPPLFALHLRPDNASSSSSSSSTSTSTFIERRTSQHTTTHHHYDLPPAMEPVQGRPEPSPPLVKTTIFQTTSRHVEDKIVDGPPVGIPKELLKEIEQRASSDDHHSTDKKVVVQKTITVKMVKKDDEEDATVIERARARSMERLALEEKQRKEQEELAKIKDQLEKERREREAIERRIREQEQSEIAKRAKQEEERLLLIRIEEEKREKYRLEQLALEERARQEVDDKARKLSEERMEMEAERRRLDEERRRLEGRRLEELKKIEEERSRLDEQRRLLSHEKNQNEAERRRMEEEMREKERRRKEEEEIRIRREEEELIRRREEEELMKRREEEESKRRRDIQRKAREEEEKERQEAQRRREREEAERKRKSMEEKNITITYERTVERTRTEEVDERVIDHRPVSPTAYMTRTYLNGDIPRQVTVIEEGGHRHDAESPIGDAPMVRFVFDESTRSYIHHLVEPPRHTQREPSPARTEVTGLRILSRTETLIDDPYDDDGEFQRDSPERVGHHRMSSPTREERYQYVRGPTDLRSPGIAATPASPEMLRRGEALRRTNQDVQRDSYPSGRESRKRERTQYENLPMDDAGNAYIIPDRMRHSKSPIIMRVKMSPKENSHQSAIAPPLPPVQREHVQPLQSTPATTAAEYSPPPLYQRTPPANASLPQRGTTPSAVHFATAIGSGAKPIGTGAGAGDQYSTIQRTPPTPVQRTSNKGTPIAPVLTPPPPAQSPSHTAPSYVRPPRQLGDNELMSPAGKAPVYGIDRPGQLLPPPPVPIHKHPQQQQPQRAPLAAPEDPYGANQRRPGGLSEEEEREYLLRLRPLDEYKRIPGEAEKGYRMRNRTTYYGEEETIPSEKIRFWVTTLVPLVIAVLLLLVLLYYLITLAPSFFTARSDMTADQREHMEALAGAFSPYPQDATWSSKPRPVETSTPENERQKKKSKGCCASWFVVFDKTRTRPLDCWDWLLPICCFCIAPIVLILITIGIILTYALN